MKMSYIPNEQKPREKILNNGVYNLSDAELLAVMLGVGTKEESVLDLSLRLINTYGLKGIFNMTYDELLKIKGIKEAKASKLVCAFEITRRALEIKDNKKELLYPKDIYEYVINDYILLQTEILTVIYVNSMCKPIRKERFSDNISSAINLPEREIIKNV